MYIVYIYIHIYLRPPTGRNLGLNWNSSLFCDRAEKQPDCQFAQEMLFRQELQFDKVGLKISSPNNQGLNFLLHVQFRQVFKNCVKASRARIPGKQAGIPGKQAGIREERFYLLAIVCFLRTRLSRNGEEEMRNSESKQKRTNFPTGEDLGSGGISRVRQKNRSKPARAQILACGGYRYIVISATQADFAYTRRQISRVLHEETSVPKLHMATPESETLANSTLLRCCNCLVMKSCKQGTLGIREAPHRHLRRSSEIVDRQHFLRMRNETIWVFRTRNGGYMAMMINHGILVYPCTPCSGKNISVHSSTYAQRGTCLPYPQQLLQVSRRTFQEPV